MKYLIMMTDIEGKWEQLPPAQQKAVMDQHGAVQNELKARNKYHSCARLGPVAEARTIRLGSGGSRIVSTGLNMTAENSRAESREFMGGYYMIEAESMDEALEWAKKLPMPYCSMELREIFED